MVEAQRRTIMTPLLAVTGLSVGLAAVLTLPLVGLAIVLAPVSVLVTAGCVVAGLLLVRLAVTTSRTVLRGVLAEGRG